MAQISKCKQMFLKHPKWATPLLFPEPWRLRYFVFQFCREQKPTPLWCKLSREVEQHTFEVSLSGWRHARSGRSRESGLDRGNLEDKSAQRFPRAPIWLVPGGLVVATVGRRLFLSAAVATGWPWCISGEMVGAPGSLPSEPPADCHARGTRGRS